MTDWAARAKAHFSHKGQDASDESDKRGVSSLLAPPIRLLCENALSAKHPNPAANDPAAVIEQDANLHLDGTAAVIKHSANLQTDDPATDIEVSANLQRADPAADILNSANLQNADPDRWCWPHSTAMNGREINTFTARLSSFTGRGLDVAHAEALADKLVIRDREQDDRRACPECLHLGGYGAASWRCGNWAAAGVAIRARDAQLPDALVNLMQRCDGFVMRG